MLDEICILAVKKCVWIKDCTHEIDISIINWNDMETLPEEHKPVLLLWFDDKYNEVHGSSAMYDKDDRGFIDSDAFDIPRVFDNALAWAEYPQLVLF